MHVETETQSPGVRGQRFTRLLLSGWKVLPFDWMENCRLQPHSLIVPLSLLFYVFLTSIQITCSTVMSAKCKRVMHHVSLPCNYLFIYLFISVIFQLTGKQKVMPFYEHFRSEKVSTEALDYYVYPLYINCSCQIDICGTAKGAVHTHMYTFIHTNTVYMFQ